MAGVTGIYGIIGRLRRREATPKHDPAESDPMKPLISVVLPVWNGARWLTEAIDSIRRQTHDNFELIVVDDGSTDGSADIIEASARSDRRIRIFHQERNGLVAALNRGLSEAQGQLIARLDADDRAHLQRLKKQTEYLDRHLDVGLLGSWAELIDEQGSVKGFRKYQTRPESLMPLLPRTNPLLHSSIMVRQSVLQKVGFYRPAFEGAEDYDLWLRVSEITKDRKSTRVFGAISATCDESNVSP